MAWPFRLWGREKASGLTPAPTNGTSGFLGIIRESFAGAWQQGVTLDDRQALLAQSAVYSCVDIISRDISKLRIKLVRQTADGIWEEVADRASPFWPVLRKPNRYQTRIKFLEQWVVAKLLYGAAYVLKERDARGIVRALYVLDSRRVTPLIAEDGSVYYQIAKDPLSGVLDQITVPASEIIHDTMVCLWHPLVGVSPIYACAASATLGNRIGSGSARFFANMSRPSGMLTAPHKISDETAARLKATFEAHYSGENIGRILVAGDDLKFLAMTMPATDAQLIEQLKWTVEDVARAFHMPLYKLQAGELPTYNNIETLNRGYFSECLQALIESIELCLDEGLGLTTSGSGDVLGTELDLDGLLRMDTVALMESIKTGVGAGVMSPNEGRFRLNLPPVAGGDTPYLQIQNYSLEALSKRDERGPPASPAAPLPAPPEVPKPEGGKSAAPLEHAEPAPPMADEMLIAISRIKALADEDLIDA